MVFENSKFLNENSGTFKLKQGPEKISEEMDYYLDALMTVAYRKDKPGLIDNVNFILPAGAHLIPLFEHKLFRKLLEVHNNQDTFARCISPTCLMSIDPDYPKLMDETGIYRGETISEHELNHEYGNQESQNYMATVARPQIVYNFAWVEAGSGIRFIIDPGYTKWNETIDMYQAANMLLAPRYFSGTDHITLFHIADRISAETGKPFEEFYRVANAAEEIRMQEFGLEYPPEASELTTKLFEKWKQYRQGQINFFPGWEPINQTY